MTVPLERKAWISQKLKFTILVNLLVAVFFVLLGAWFYFQTRAHDQKVGIAYAEAVSLQYANKVQLLLEEALRTANTLSLSMSSFESIPRESRRRYYMDLSKRLLERHPRWQAVWIQWEPRLLDALDARYANNNPDGAGTETGAFAPFWTRGPNGIILQDSFDADYNKEYYTIPKDVGQEWVTEPYYDEIQGVKTLMVTASAPIYDTRGVFQGVIGIDYSLETLGEEIGQLLIYKTGYGRLISPKGILAYHRNKDRLGKLAPEWENDWGEEIRRGISSGKVFSRFLYSQSRQMMTLKTFVPFILGKTGSVWTWSVEIGIDEFYEASDQFLINYSIIFSLVMILLMAILSLLMERLMKPVMQLRLSMREFAAGNADLRTRLQVRGRHEIAQLANYFNTFVEGLGQNVIETRSQIESLEKVSKKLEQNMDAIGDRLHRVQESLRSMKSTAGLQSSNVMEVSSTVEEITGNLKSLSQQVERQNQALASAASAVEEMVANIQNITRNVDISMNAFTRLKNVSDQGYEKLEEVNEVIRNISLQSEGLQEANSIINNIASQTNLLAMNAAIEAAHAGEAGKGFAVVADEIRKLAEESANRSHEISQLLKSLHSLSDQAVNSSNEAGSAFEAIRHSVDEVTNRQLEIRAAVEQQTVGNRQVLDGVQQLKEIATEVEMGSREMALGSQSILKLVMNVVESTRNITRAIQDIEAATDEIEASTQETIDTSRVNKKAAEKLGDLIKRFKI